MNDNQILALVEEGQYEAVENYWLEQMESGHYEVEDFFRIARALGRQREKGRAIFLMMLLADDLKEKGNWSAYLRVSKEIAKHSQDPNKLHDIRDEIRDALLHVYPNRPSFQQIMRHFGYDDISAFGSLAASVQNIEQWLSHDVGQLFYSQGSGVGKVTEINLKLGLVRLDFEKRKDVTVELGDTELIPLEQGHLLREKIEHPEEVRQKAKSEPAMMLGRLLQEFARPMSVAEIKECLNGVVSAGDWAKWWTAARKHPQVMVSGKGAQAVYSWSDSAAAAEETVKTAFAEADTRSRIELVKQHGNRSEELAGYFRDLLLQDAVRAYQSDEAGLALELLELFSKWPGASTVDPGYSLEDLLLKVDTKKLLAGIDNFNLKSKILREIRQRFPEKWRTLFAEFFLQEENPKVLALLYDTLCQDAANVSLTLLDRVAADPYLHPPAFTWICEMGAQEGLNVVSDPIGRKLDGKFLLVVLLAIDEDEYSVHRNRLKKAMESGLLVNILGKTIEQETAQRAVEILEHSDCIEDYRRERWKNTIRARFPAMAKKEEWIFTTKEAYDRKREEFDHLVKVELPKNRKAVGEAAALGDLSENHEYKAARERQDYLINRVEQLQNELRKARFLEPGRVDCSEVRPGTRVILVQPPEKKTAITLLGPWDSNPKEGIYSYQSPIGIGLLGKTPGEKVELNSESWTIEKIEPF